MDRIEKLRRHYEYLGTLKDDRVTAFDSHLRDLEITYAQSHMTSNAHVLDVGCGGGVACFAYAPHAQHVTGLDLSQSMIDFAEEKREAMASEFKEKISFQQGSVLAIPFGDNSFNVITTHRVLIALLSWDVQKEALQEILRCLKPGGVFVMFEATVEGLQKLNAYRALFNLDLIQEGGREDYDRLLFSEKQLQDFMTPQCRLETIHTFGMYYFLTRIVQPLYVSPEKPRYDHPLNKVAFQIAQTQPDFDDLGHLKGFVWRKK